MKMMVLVSAGEVSLISPVIDRYHQQKHSVRLYVVGESFERGNWMWNVLKAVM